jgi:hypothetical protein
MTTFIWREENVIKRCSNLIKYLSRYSALHFRIKSREYEVTNIEKNILRWLGHVERMDERRIMNTDFDGNILKGR